MGRHRRRTYEQEFAPVPDLTPSIRNALRSSTLLALVLGFGLSVAPVY
jgi:hypothetical protein